MKVRFSFFGLGLSSRFVLSALCYAAVVVLQIVIPAGHPFRFLVLALCALPLLFLKAKNFSNRPKDLGKEEWKPVTMKEIDRLADRMRNVKRVKVGVSYGKSFAMVALILLPFTAVLLSALFGLSLFFFFVELVLFFIPLFWFARVDKWYPVELSDKLKVLAGVLGYSAGPSYKIVPMLRFDEDKLGRKIPEDIKVMVEPRLPPKAQEKPNELVGVQFQVAINSGPDGKVPYVYAVFITRGSGPVRKTLSRMRFFSWVTETDSDGEFGTVVLRLDTKSRGDGYHTKGPDVEELTGHVFRILSGLQSGET
jgi:hypothetical protein